MRARTNDVVAASRAGVVRVRALAGAAAARHRTSVKPLHLVRPATHADLEECVALARLAAPERTASEWRGSLLRDVDDPAHRLVVAEVGGTVVAYGRTRLFEPGPEAPPDTAPRGYYLIGVFVHPEERRRGIAAALTQARLEWIAARADEAWFFANARNSASIELHRPFGFEEVTRRFSFPGLAFDGGEGILFRLRLRRQA
jgi:ribosomal protein S18 acetylase RimI-like enzyme